MLFFPALFVSAAMAGDGRGVNVAPAPAWVRPVAEPGPAGRGGNSLPGGSEYLLVDEQFDAGSMSSYFHSVVRVLDVASFDEGQNLRIEYDPAYERLEVHHARLRRAGETVDLLRRQAFRVIQREDKLESDLYEARLTALLLMEDL